MARQILLTYRNSQLAVAPQVGIRLNKQPPNIVVRKKDKGGINFSTSVKLTYMDEDAVRAILSEYRINSADVRINCDATPDELIDVTMLRAATSRRLLPTRSSVLREGAAFSFFRRAVSSRRLLAGRVSFLPEPRDFFF